MCLMYVCVTVQVCVGVCLWVGVWKGVRLCVFAHKSSSLQYDPQKGIPIFKIKIF